MVKESLLNPRRIREERVRLAYLNGLAATLGPRLVELAPGASWTCDECGIRDSVDLNIPNPCEGEQCPMNCTGCVKQVQREAQGQYATVCWDECKLRQGTCARCEHRVWQEDPEGTENKLAEEMLEAMWHHGELEGFDEGHFSWSPCDACGSTLGGDRFSAHGFFLPEGMKREDLHSLGQTNTVHLDICQDCLMYFENGDLPLQEGYEWEDVPRSDQPEDQYYHHLVTVELAQRVALFAHYYHLSKDGCTEYPRWRRLLETACAWLVKFDVPFPEGYTADEIKHSVAWKEMVEQYICKGCSEEAK